MRQFEPLKAGDRLNMQVVWAGTGQEETAKEGQRRESGGKGNTDTQRRRLEGKDEKNKETIKMIEE